MKKLFKSELQNITYMLSDIGLYGSIMVKTDFDRPKSSSDIEKIFTLIPVEDIFKIVDMVELKQKYDYPEPPKKVNELRKHEQLYHGSIKAVQGEAATAQFDEGVTEKLHKRITENDKSIQEANERINNLAIDFFRILEMVIG